MGARDAGRRLLAGLCILVLAGGCASAAASPSPTTVTVPVPNGSDDTGAIQDALDACVKHGPGCTIELQAGTYKTRQVVATNFRGTFKGAGQDQTIIEALPDLPVNVPDFVFAGECMPNTTTCLWPSLVIFVDGDIGVSDLAIHVTATGGHATAPWVIGGSTLTSLVDALRFMGQHPTNVVVDRVAIEGRRDDANAGFGGYNLVNGILYAGELPRSSTPFDYYPLGGSLIVRNSSFTSLNDGGFADGFLESVHVTIGGSSSTGNHFEDVNAGIDLETAQGSTFDVSYNTSSAALVSMSMEPWQPAFVPSSPSTYEIHDNTFVSANDVRSKGIVVQDDPAHRWIQAKITHNAITLGGQRTEGIAVHDAAGTAISDNSITGTTGDARAVSLWGATKGSVTGNDLTGLAADPKVSPSQIYLDPATAETQVACSSPSNTVFDEGTGNTLTGCTRTQR
jgi:hypothetical protein